jgi:hypothetical protein
MLGLGFVLHVVDLPNVALFLLVALETVVDTGGRAGWLVEKGLQAEAMGVYCILIGIVAREDGSRPRVIIESEVVPAVGVHSGEVESKRQVQISHLNIIKRRECSSYIFLFINSYHKLPNTIK